MVPGTKRGRPSKFNETLANAILAMAEAGADDKSICSKLGIPLSTLDGWKSRFPDFRSAILESKSIADELVEATMFRLAVGGYVVPRLKVIYDQERGEFKMHQYAEVLAPSFAACDTWLRNRQPHEWRRNPDDNDDRDDDVAIDVDWKVEILGEKPMSLSDLRDMAERYYDRKPALKVVSDEPS